MLLCMNCLSLGYCAKVTCILVSDVELNNLDFVEDVRAFACALAVPPSNWRDFIYNTYRDYPGRVLGPRGDEVFLDLEVFETDGAREWFRDWVYRTDPLSRSKKLRAESYDRVRVIGTLLRAQNPEKTMTWGLRAANDNTPPS